MDTIPLKNILRHYFTLRDEGNARLFKRSVLVVSRSSAFTAFTKPFFPKRNTTVGVFHYSGSGNTPKDLQPLYRIKMSIRLMPLHSSLLLAEYP